MKKYLVTLNISNEQNPLGWEPELTELTYPYLQKYADKIGASFKVLTERKLTKPDDGLPIILEKFQVHQMLKEEDCIVIYVDSDAILRLDAPDFSTLIPRGSVFFWGSENSTTHFRTNNWFIRNKRYHSACSWYVIADSISKDLWLPPNTEEIEWAKTQIYPTAKEIGIKNNLNLLDDFWLSCNISRYGLEYYHGAQIQQQYNIQGAYAHHQYTEPSENQYLIDQEGCLVKEKNVVMGKKQGIIEAMRAWGMPRLYRDGRKIQ